MIYELSKRTIEYIASLSDQPSDQDQLDVYIYGMECFLNTAIPVVLLTIWSIMFDSLIETFLWLFAFSLLREYTGGYHASTQFACITSSTMLGIGNTLVSQNLELSNVYIALCYFLCIIVVLLCCPIPSHKKTFDPIQRKQYKIRALGIILFFLFLSMILPTSYSVTLTYSCLSCILLAIIELFSRKFFI